MLLRQVRSPQALKIQMLSTWVLILRPEDASNRTPKISWARWRGSCNCWSVCAYLQETLGRESVLGFLDICEHVSLPKVPLRGSFRHSVDMESCGQFEEKIHSRFEVNLASVFKEDSPIYYE